MNITLTHAKNCAVQNPEVAAETFSKRELYAVIDAMAQEQRQGTESIEHARARIGKTSEGQKILKAYGMAKAEPIKKAAPPVSPEAFRKALPGGNILAQVEEAAKKLAREENISLVKARSEVWLRRPDLKQAYDARLSAGPGPPDLGC